MRLTSNCTICNKILVQTGEIYLQNAAGDPAEISQRDYIESPRTKLSFYKCGHFFIEHTKCIDPSKLNLSSVDGTKSARPYQTDGVRFIMEAKYNCILADQMRLGKTPQALLALKNDYENQTPCLEIVKSANLWQWIREHKVWCDDDPFGIFPIVNTNNYIPLGFKTYIISMDTFSRTCRDGIAMSDKLLKFGFKLVIADEMHSFKNTESNRTKALIRFLKEINKATLEKELQFNCPYCDRIWNETVTIEVSHSDSVRRTSKSSVCSQCGAAVYTAAAVKTEIKRNCNVLMLSGTPIKNRTDEYFVPLNILIPDRVSSIERFRRTFLMQDQKGKWSRLSPYAADEFKAMIKPYVLRREKEDVYTDLPALNRIFTVIELTDDSLKKTYNKILGNIEANLERGNYKFFDNIGELSQLRQICGSAKIKWATDYIEASLYDNDKKIAVGIHHQHVRDELYYLLSNIGVVKLSGEDSPARKDHIMTSFEHSPERVLVINTLAGGVGMDFHYIDDVLILERQWSSADEEQFEFRFYNPDKSIKDRPTNVEYILCKDTVDEFFHDLVAGKRMMFGETIGTNWSLESDTESFKQLLERTVGSRLA